MEYPAQRLGYIIADTRLALVITRQSLVHRLAGACADTVATVLMTADAPWQQVPPAGKSLPASSPSSPAYVMYTSGSTGRPKGVVVPHIAVVRLVMGQTYAAFGPHLRTLLLAPTAFDASTFELWAPLLHGGTCVVFPDQLPDFSPLAKVLREGRVNCLWLTAGLFNQVIDHAPDMLSTVDQIITGGDVLSMPHVRRATELLPNARLTNGYGPTESTTFACSHDIRPEDLGRVSVPIGRPLAHTTCLLVDELLQPVAEGMAGELLIGGLGLALGYLNQPELSAEKFIFVGGVGSAGERFYRTGDRCRWLPGGELEFLGRFDNQVKIRGHRIELGEVESVLAGHPAVKSCAVIAVDRGNGKQLEAVLVSGESGRLSIG